MNCVLRFSSDSRFDCLLGLFAALLVPMSGVVTQGVEQDHPALDISCRVGRPVRAAHDGVGRSRWTATHGWTFHLAGAGVKTRYSHLSAGAPAGSYSRGQIIGLCGNTGRWSTGPHLHFEAEPLHLLDVLESPSAEQLKSMEQTPQWRQRSVEASR